LGQPSPGGVDAFEFGFPGPQMSRRDRTATLPDIAAPHAAALVESLRAFGYELPTAIADLVDNSISAGARTVWIDFHWDGDRSIIAVTDDGRGMTEDQLAVAMRVGSKNPLAVRDPDDYGRFGLGMKTASFSQCRRLTVRTRASRGETVTRCWDLDHIARVDAWQMLRDADDPAEQLLGNFAKLKHGTAVIWQKMDRLVAGQRTESDRDQQMFLNKADAVRSQLGMVFNLLTSGPRAVSLILNGRPINAWDAFLSDDPATQALPVTRLKLGQAVVEVEPFVLPHHSKLAKAKHRAAAGPNGWNAHQGFYVYRNRRLLVPGDWLGFGWAKEEHYKLARIRVEIPNSLDGDWAIDVTKSRAHPPAGLREELRRIGERARNDAKRVYSHRGAILAPKGEERLMLWLTAARHDKTFYRLNREHPLLKRALEAAIDRQALNALLRLIEETTPFAHITIENSERPNSLPGPFEHSPESQIREVMEQAFESLVASGYGTKEAIDRLRTIWPFELFPALLQSLAESKPHD
jgi:hypothetical protein